MDHLAAHPSRSFGAAAVVGLWHAFAAIVAADDISLARPMMSRGEPGWLRAANEPATVCKKAKRLLRRYRLSRYQAAQILTLRPEGGTSDPRNHPVPMD
jgi:hypothetical protein